MAPPRKPKQERSKATVDAIVEATGQVFEREGFRRTTTVRVADRAGVSVGSLYQYFPDKKSLIGAFFQRRLAQDIALMERIAGQARDLTLDALADLCVRELVALFRDERELYQSVAEILPMMEQTEELQVSLEGAVALGAEYLKRYPDELAGRDPELLSRLLFRGLRAGLLSVVAVTPEKLDDPTLEQVLGAAARAILLGDDVHGRGE